ncbi:MAG: ABC transporter substrate-binding protein [Chloroflexota bacterium]|nr:ABC transporter substrate-binding protein [Chloroflexota bacterium]
MITKAAGTPAGFMLSADSMNRRAVLKLMLGGAGALVLTACGGSSSPAPSKPSSASAAPSSRASSPKSSGQPASGGVFRAGIQSDLPNLDPFFNSPSVYDTLWLAFDRLIALDSKRQPQPVLAESWEVSSDDKQATFHLRKGVRFSTGRELTSDDVKWNLLHVRDPKVGGGGWVTFSKWWTSIETPDKYTVVLKSDQPRPLLFDNLETFNIADRVTAEGPNAKTQVVGTGPFVLKEWVQGDHITLVKNKDYWQSGQPLLNEMRFQIFHDAPAMVSQFEAGAVNMVLNPPLRDLSRLKSDPKYQAITNPYTGRYFIAGWNAQNKPLDNKIVRQALNYAMDRKRFANSILLGLSKPIALPWGVSSPAYDPTKANYYAFDLDKAKALLKQANVEGFELEYLYSPIYPELGDLGQIYQADLAQIGVKLTLKLVDPATFFDAINHRKYPGMYVITSARANLAPGITILSTQGYNPASNNEGFQNAKYTQLANEMATVADPKKQQQIHAQMNDLLIDEAFCLAIASASPRMLVDKNVRGIGYTMHEGFTWTKVSTAS